MPRITFMPENKSCEFKTGLTILDVAVENKVSLNHSCGGMGSCTTCRVKVVKGVDKLKEREDVEAEHAKMRGWSKDERLSCQTQAADGVVVVIPEPEI